MLKPRYVHGVNPEEAPKSVLHRLQNEAQKVWPFDDVPPVDPAAGPPNTWTWGLG